MTRTHRAVGAQGDAGYPCVSTEMQLERDALRYQVQALQQLSIDRSQFEAVTEEARETFAAAFRPLTEQGEEAARELERLRSKLASLLELAEDRLISKEEYAARKARLEGDREALEERLNGLDAELAARADTTVDIDGVVAGLRHLRDVYDVLEDVAERRRLLASCVSQVVVKPAELELHLSAYPVLIRPSEGPGSAPEAPGSAHPGVPGKFHSASRRGSRRGPPGAEKWAKSPRQDHAGSSNRVGVRERMDAHVSANAHASKRAYRVLASQPPSLVHNGLDDETPQLCFPRSQLLNTRVVRYPLNADLRAALESGGRSRGLGFVGHVNGQGIRLEAEVTRVDSFALRNPLILGTY